MYTRELWQRSVACVVASMLVISGCGDDPKPSNNNDNNDMGTATNQPPVAKVDANRNVSVGMRVTADGSQSEDPDGDVITPSWVMIAKPDGSAAELTGATSFSPSFVPDVVGVYTLELTVSDGTLTNVAPARVSYNARPAGPNQAPVARAGADRTVVLGETVALDGAGSTDANGDMLTFTWSIASAPGGSAATLASPSAAKTDFTPDVQGAYTLRLVVNDGTTDSAPDELLLNVMSDVPPNARPVADAGVDQMGMVGVQVALSGAGSSDGDDDALTYSWALVQRPMGSAAALSAADAVDTTFVPDVGGRYIAELIVDDGIEPSLPDRVTIDVQGMGASPPTALIRGPRTALLGSQVRLDGSGSSDPDGDTLSFMWSLKSKPAGSLVFLNGGSTSMPTLTPDREGDYVVSLKVNDGTFDSPTVELTIAASDDPFAGTCFIISEYIEGTSNNKALELFNCSSTETLDLSRYGVCLMSSSGASCNTTVKLSGTLSPGAVFGICNSQISSQIKSMLPAGACDIDSGVTSFNGDDRVILFEDTNDNGAYNAGQDNLMDTFGEPGFQPGSIWANVTYRRCDLSPFDGTQNMFNVDQLYTVAAVDDFSNLGTPPTAGCVTDRPPVANAGMAQTIVIGAIVTLNGSASSDPEGQPLTYAWTIANAPQGSVATLSDATAAQPTFTPDLVGAYTLSLIVNDGTLNSAAATVTITVNAVPNLRPVAVAGANQTLPASPAPIMLDGSGSADPEAQPITYAWTLVTKPMGSAAALSATNTAQTGFQADIDGLYIAQLIVNDGVQDSLPSRVNVQVGVVQNCLIISEVVEGSGNNKALELFNCGGAPFDLAGTGLCVHFNGGAACTGVELLMGTVAPGAVYTLCNSSTMSSLLPAGYTCDKTISNAGQNATSFNGNDPIVLFRDVNSSGGFNAGDVIIDAFGKPAVAPNGTPWQDKTFRRCDRTPYDGTGDFTAASYYSSHAVDDLSDLGTAPTAMTCQ